MTTWLIDKSALVRLAASPDAAEWAGRIERGMVRVTTVTRLEAGCAARSGPELRAGLRQSRCHPCQPTAASTARRPYRT